MMYLHIDYKYTDGDAPTSRSQSLGIEFSVEIEIKKLFIKNFNKFKIDVKFLQKNSEYLILSEFSKVKKFKIIIR